MAQNFFLLPPFLLESSLSMYFSICNFCFTDFYINQKSLLHFFLSVTEREIGLTTEFVFVLLVTLVTGDMTVQKFFCNLCLFLSHQTACIFYLLLLLH